MISKQTLGRVTWLDVQSPTPEEVRELADTYAIDERVADELLLPSPKPHTTPFGGGVYLVLHFPALRHTNAVTHNQEVNFVLKKDTIITVRYETLDTLHKATKMAEMKTALESTTVISNAGVLFFLIARKLYRALIRELDVIEDNLRTIEGHIFQGNEKNMVVELSNISRDLLAFKQAVIPHRDILADFKDAGIRFFGEGYREHARAILSEYYRVYHTVASRSAMLEELRATNDSLLSTKQNEVMKILTIMAFVTFPLSLLASIFGMNTQLLPIVGHSLDFWIIIGIMAFATACFFIFFKYKKWL